MKKIFALVLILAMLIPFAVACDGGDETTTENIVKDDKFTSKDTIKKDWEGKTLLVAATSWSKNPSYPWSTMELVIKEGETSGWGEKIDKAVLERTAYIKKTYGVDVIWEHSSRYNTYDVLANAILAGNDPDYDLAMPRAMHAQAIVANGSVYDMANRPYIDFNNSYYNQDSIKTYTAKGHTFFIAGDFSTLDKETAFVLYFNKLLLGGKEATEELYQLVMDGKWTWDKLVTYASPVYINDDGRWDDTDIYGLYTTSYAKFYEYFGVKQAGVNEATGEWEITLNAPTVNDIVSAIITADTSAWVRGPWGGSWGHSEDDIADDRLLFYNGVIQSITYIAYSMFADNIGIVPFPMLNEEQGRYYVPCSSQYSTLICVPKTTSDRDMSDYFIDVLAWTGSEYVMEAYCDKLAGKFGSEDDMEMLTEYIFPNICFDAGNAVGWGMLMDFVTGYSYYNDGNKFDAAYAEQEDEALETIKEWNDAWGSYTE